MTEGFQSTRLGAAVALTEAYKWSFNQDWHLRSMAEFWRNPIWYFFESEGRGGEKKKREKEETRGASVCVVCSKSPKCTYT